MASEVEIVNNALLLFGGDTIVSLDDNTTRAKIAKNIFGPTRDAVLRAHAWNCAISRAKLGLSSSAPSYSWTYKYPLPSDPYCLRVLSLNESQEDGDPGDEFRIEGRFLVTNEGTADIQFIKRITDPNEFDANLYQALSFRLAAAMSYSITGSQAVVTAMWTLYENMIKEARSIDGQEGSPDHAEVTTLTEIR
jgi:hypothetical protein